MSQVIQYPNEKVWVAWYETAYEQGTNLIGAFSSEDLARQACESDKGGPLDWSRGNDHVVAKGEHATSSHSYCIEETECVSSASEAMTAAGVN